ncbi:ethylene-responsive transcription factor [Ranunculus cassubicifolius]
MATQDEASVLDQIRQHLLGDLGELEDFLMDFDASNLDVKAEPEISTSESYYSSSPSTSESSISDSSQINFSDLQFYKVDDSGKVQKLRGMIRIAVLQLFG